MGYTCYGTTSYWAQPIPRQFHRYDSVQSTYYELSLIIKNGNIPVKPNPNITLLILQPNLPRRILTAPSHNILDRNPPPLPLSPQNIQSQANTADPTPGCKEIALAALGLLMNLNGRQMRWE